MKGYLLDENLPRRLLIRAALPMRHSAEVAGRAATDAALWEVARKEDWVLVTKDADFSARKPLVSPLCFLPVGEPD